MPFTIKVVGTDKVINKLNEIMGMSKLKPIIKHDIGKHFWIGNSLIEIEDVSVELDGRVSKVIFRYIESGAVSKRYGSMSLRQLGDDPQFDKKRFTHIKRRTNGLIKAYKTVALSLEANGIKVR